MAAALICQWVAVCQPDTLLQPLHSKGVAFVVYRAEKRIKGRATGQRPKRNCGTLSPLRSTLNGVECYKLFSGGSGSSGSTHSGTCHLNCAYDNFLRSYHFEAFVVQVTSLDSLAKVE